MQPVDPAAATESLRSRHPALDLAPGTLLAGRFRIEALLGIGGMGVVYRARDLTLDIDVALKLLRPEWAARSQAFERFRQELLLARQVSSPQVVRIHDIAQHDELCFISMDLVEGEALDKRLDRAGALPLAEVLAIAKDIAHGLAAAHAVGVVHRDLKPANVLIDHSGRARIADFGVARSLGSGGSSAGSLVGTPEYLSPEQARGEPADARSDLYALGLILYEMLSGQLPFAGLTAAESLSQRMWRAPAAVQSLRADTPLWLQRLLDRLLRPKPGHRVASANAVLSALESERLPRDWRALARSAAAMLLATALAGVLWLAWSWRPAPVLPVPDRWVLLPITTDSSDAALQLALPAVEEWLRQALQTLPGATVVSAERTRLALAQVGLEGGAPVADRTLLDALPARRVLALRLDAAGGGLRLTGELRQAGSPAQRIDAGPAADSLGAAGSDLWQQLAARVIPGAPPAAATMPSDAALRQCGEGMLLRGQGEFEAALAAFERCAQQAPQAALGWRLWLESAEFAGQSAAAQPAQAWPEDTTTRSLWQAWLSGEQEKALAALEVALQSRADDLDGQLQLARWQSQSGHFESADLTLQALLARDDKDARAWFLRGKTAILRGDPRRAVEDYLVRALVLFKRSRDRNGEADTTNALGVGYARLGQSADAEEHYRKAVALRRALGHRRGIASSLRNLGQMALVRGRVDEARASFDEARALFDALQDRAGVAAIDNELGMLAEERGDFRQALQAYRAALRGREAEDDLQGVAESLNNIGYAHFQLGAYDSAGVFWQQALDTFDRTDDGNGQLRARQNLGLLAIAAGDWPKAERLLLDTLRDAEALSLLEEAAVSLRNLAELDLLRARFDSAETRLQRAQALFAERDDRRGLFDAGLLQLRALLARGDHHDVQARLDALAQSAAEASFEQQALLALLRAEWASGRDDPAARAPALVEASRAAERAGVAALGLRLRLQALTDAEGPTAEAVDADILQLGNLPLRLTWARHRLELAASPQAFATHYRALLPLLRRHPGALESQRCHRLALARLDAAAEPALLAAARTALAEAQPPTLEQHPEEPRDARR